MLAEVDALLGRALLQPPLAQAPSRQLDTHPVQLHPLVNPPCSPAMTCTLADYRSAFMWELACRG